MRAATLETYFSKLAFVFLIFAVVSGGYISEVLSCQFQKLLQTSREARWIMGYTMVFVFIMLEGGWSFDQKLNDRAPNDWSSGNVIDSFILAGIIFTIFGLSSKMRLMPNVAFFAALLTLYCVSAQRRFWRARGMLTHRGDDTMQRITYAAAGVLLGVLVYGIHDYYGYEKLKHADDFSIQKFFFGTIRCASLGPQK